MSARHRRSADPAGLLLLDKPLGISSFQAAKRAARILGVRRVGHAGTLDPAAGGLLPLFFGPATRLVEYLSSGFKEYVAQILLGVETDTLDAEGRVVARSPVDPDLDFAAVEAVCKKFVGRVEQVVPAYSAVKIGGRRLYELARNGQQPKDLPRRTVEITDIELLAFESPLMTIRVTCGKGTYVRVLASDIGRSLGTRASLAGLTRSAVGPFRLERAVGLDELDASREPWAWVLSPLVALSGLTRLDLTERLHQRLRQGQVLDADLGKGLWDRLQSGRPIVAPAPDGRTVVIVEVVDGNLRPKKVVSLAGRSDPIF